MFGGHRMRVKFVSLVCNLRRCCTRCSEIMPLQSLVEHKIWKTKNQNLNLHQSMTVKLKPHQCTTNWITYRTLSSNTSQPPKLIYPNVSPKLPIIGKRPTKKKCQPWLDDDHYVMSAHSTAEEYALEKVKEAMVDGGVYVAGDLPQDADDAIYLKAKYEIENVPREMFIFRQGCVVFWNMPNTEMQSVLQLVRQYSDGVYSVTLAKGEEENMDYVYTEEASNLHGGVISIQHEPETGESMVLSKYAFSNAFCTSVKLGIWEATLDEFVESIEPILEDLTEGKRLRMSRHEVLRKTGELYTLRHQINLSSDLLEPPDFYWDRDELETLYTKSIVYLNIPKRTRVINEKLHHCCDLTDLLSSHLKDNHHLRLEWMIIILIAIEVVFEIPHLIAWFTQRSDNPQDQTSE